MDVLPTPSMDVMSTLAPPALRESSRKRVRKTLGPDFVDFSGPVRFRPHPAPAGEETTAKKLPAKKESFSDSKLLKKVVVKRNGLTKRKSAKPQRKGLPAAIPVQEVETIAISAVDVDAFCSVCAVKVRQVIKNGISGGNLEGLAVRCATKGCNYTGHILCLGYVANFKDYRCPDCSRKQCVVCKKGNVLQQQDEMVRCCRCKKAYHFICHLPPVDKTKRKSPAGILRPWTCSSCRVVRRRTKKSIRPFHPIRSQTVIQGLAAPSDLPDHSYALPLQLPLLSPALIGPTLYKPHAELVDPLVKDRNTTKGDENEDKPADGKEKELIPLLMPGQPFDSMLAPESMLIFGPQDERVRERMERDRELRLDMAWWTVEQCAAYFQDSHPELAQLIVDNDVRSCLYQDRSSWICSNCRLEKP